VGSDVAQPPQSFILCNVVRVLGDNKFLQHPQNPLTGDAIIFTVTAGGVGDIA